VARARRISDENGLGQLIQTMYSRLASTWLAWMAGELSAAEEAAVGLQRYCEVAADAPIVVQHALLRSRIRWSLGDSLGARSLLDRATVLSNGRPVEGHFAGRLSLGRAMLDLLDGEVESAQRAMPDWRIRLEGQPQTMRERLVQLRMLLLTGGDLAPIHVPAPSGLNPGPLEEIDLGRLRAMAYLQEGRIDDATRVLTASLREADRLGVIQPTLDDRDRLAPILGVASREAGVTLPGQAGGAPAAETVYVEPLSKRELTILRLLASHLTYTEMADELYISPNTVRSHVGAIFRKLAVNRRSEAVTQGRAYGLIS
jgi:DNA-binding CsgD family transcriptional regulator